jgi:hypothetical protein
LGDKSSKYKIWEDRNVESIIFCLSANVDMGKLTERVYGSKSIGYNETINYEEVESHHLVIAYMLFWPLLGTQIRLRIKERDLCHHT